MSHSSTSSSSDGGRDGRDVPPGGPLHSKRMVFLAAAIVLIISELTATALAERLPPPEGWGVRDFELQVARMKERSNGEEACLVFVGSSAVGAAVDPEVLKSVVDGDGWYAAWLAGATVRLLEPWSLEVVQPLLEPDFVVIGLTSRELNDAYTGGDGLLTSYLESPARQRLVEDDPSLRQRLSQLAEDTSALFAMRPYLRSPGELAGRLMGRLPMMAPLYGQHEGFRDSAHFDDPAEFARVQSYVDEYAVGGREAEALGRLITALEHRGVRVALADLPVMEALYAPLHEHGEADLDAYREVLDAVAADHGVPLFAYPGELQAEEWFGDWIHLGGRGSIEFSERLSDDLRAWMRTPAGEVSEAGKRCA